MEFEAVERYGHEEDADEKIGIARIRLTLPAGRMTVVVSGFSEADRALAAWKEKFCPVRTCEYTIQFADGASLRGSFSSASKKLELPSLWRVVRITLGIANATEGLHVDHALVDRDGNALAADLLKRYALERA